MRIIHFSHTPLVGAPGRVCAALNKLEGIESRWVVLDDSNYGDLKFKTDWIWSKDTDRVLEYLSSADIIHLHNYVDLRCTDFYPISFTQLFDQNFPMVRQFHSNPDLIARYMNISSTEVHACPIPKLVVGQYQERFYDCARIVPNIVDFDRRRNIRTGLPLRIGYAPSNYRSARISRWDTKGYQETIKVLNRIIRKVRNKGLPIELDIIHKVPHSECMDRKANCDLFIDDLVTGSYHLNTLEALAIGQATLCFLDDRVKQTLFDLTRRSDFPVLNVRLEDVEAVIQDLAETPEIVRAIGDHARTWMELNWNEELMAKHYIDSYHMTIQSPHKPFEKRFSKSPSIKYMNSGVHDSIWNARHARWPQPLPEPLLKIKEAGCVLLRKLHLKT
jgi:hypothetical protein